MPTASDLPGRDSSRRLTPVDEEKTKGKVWNGYVCPGCRSVFRVAADFIGSDVICPSCHETLRLPKSPDERQPLTTAPVAMPSKPTKPSRETPSVGMQTQPPKEPEEPTFETVLSSRNGRIKFALALLLPLAAVAAVLVFQPWEKSASSVVVAEKTPTEPSEIIKPAKPVPPPPVAVNEMPRTNPAETTVSKKSEPANASVEPAAAMPPPLPEIVQAIPQTPAGAVAEIPADSIAVIPTPPAPVLEEEDLIEAVPADFKPQPVEKPKSSATARAEAKPAPAPLAPAATPRTATKPTGIVHTVARGDTLTKISRAYQVGVPEIRKANGMRTDAVLLGQQLIIPGGISPAPPAASTPAPAPSKTPLAQAEGKSRSHTVVRGDTLERIARKYRVEPRAIMTANGMKNDVVYLGRKLVIPAP